MKMDTINEMIWHGAGDAIIVGEIKAFESWFAMLPKEIAVLNGLLKIAVYANKPEIVVYLLDQGAQANQVNKDNATLFSIAVEIGALTVAQSLLKKDQTALNQPDDLGWTPLHFAALNKDRNMMKWLTSQGAKDDILTHTGISAEDLFCGNLSPKDQYITQHIKAVQQSFAKQKEIFIQNNSTQNRQYLLCRMIELHRLHCVYRKDENRQELLYEVLRLSHYLPDPVEWVDILSRTVSALLQQGAQADESALYWAIIKGVPVLDVLFKHMAQPILAMDNLKNKKTGMSCVDLLLYYLTERLQEKEFGTSQSLQWYTATIMQLINAGAQFSWEKIPQPLKEPISTCLAQNPEYHAIFHSVQPLADQLYNVGEYGPLTPPNTDSSQSDACSEATGAGRYKPF